MDKEDKEVKEEEEEKKGRKREDKRPLLFKLHNTNEGDYWLFLHMSLRSTALELTTHIKFLKKSVSLANFRSVSVVSDYKWSICIQCEALG